MIDLLFAGSRTAYGDQIDRGGMRRNAHHRA
jgi:hypothetical protein